MKRFCLVLFLFPFFLMAQQVTKGKNGYVIDLSKKKKTSQDTTSQVSSDPEFDEDGNEVKVKGRKYKQTHKPSSRSSEKFDFKNEPVFKGLFSAGLNACQIDGDNQWGYKYFGAEVGVGAMARFHRFLSASLELDYTMKGAKDRLQSTSEALQNYQVQWDYMSVPIALNAHFFRDHITVSAGSAPSFMVRYKEFNQDGINVTGHSSYGQPSMFDLTVFAGIQYTFKQHYALGFRYAYSTISIRKAGAGTRTNGQYNNVLNFRFVYILSRPLRK